jgi:uncharacterized protein
MSVLPNRPIEYAMTHAPSTAGRRSCPRPKEVRAIAKRLQAWRKAPETCTHCKNAATVLRGDDPVCPTCYAQRTQDLPARFRAGELRADRLPKEGALAGHAIVVNSLSVDLGGFREIIKPSALERTEAERPDLRALWNHDSSFPLARYTAGTLAYRVDRRGLLVEIDPDAEVSHARDLVRMVGRGDVTGQSFGFFVLEDDWRVDEARGIVLRDVLDMSVIETSAVTWPAYEATDLAVVSGQRKREVDARLRLAR